MATNETDWRLLNYEGYNDMLDGKEFELKKHHSTHPNDHDHCILCWKTISNASGSNDDVEGYCCYNEQTKQTNWICKNCFDEFRLRFNWKIKNN